MLLYSVLRFSSNTKSLPASGCGMWTVASSADRAAAESGMAGLGSEPMATLCLEWLEPLLERSDSDESCLAEPAALRRPRLTLRALRACCLCQPGRRMYGSAMEVQLCLSRSCWSPARAHQEGQVLAVEHVLDEP